MNISIGNCPDCGHYPTQFIAIQGGEANVLHLPPSGADDCSAAEARKLVQQLAAAQAEARGWEEQSHIWQDRAENAECRVARIEGELARVREALSDLYLQYKCGCGHPACRSCGRDRDAEAALSQPVEQPSAPVGDLPLMARRSWIPDWAVELGWSTQGLCHPIDKHGTVYTSLAEGTGRQKHATYRIADTDEHGLPVIERTAEMPAEAKYRFRNTWAEAIFYADEYDPGEHTDNWQRIEDYIPKEEP